MWGIFGKPLRRANWITLGLHVVLTVCSRFSSVLDRACVACCLCLSTGIHTAYKFTQRAVASPDAPQKALVRKRARSGGADWVKIARETTPSKAKRPRTAGSQQPACTHKEHLILDDGLWAMPLNTGWVPVKARRLQDWEKLKKYVPIHKQGDVCPNGVPALVEGNNNANDSGLE